MTLASRRVWALYAFFLSWAGLLCVWIHGALSARERENLHQAHAALIAFAALSSGQELFPPSPLLEARLRRLADDGPGRYALLVGTDGQVLARAGDPPPPEGEEDRTRRALAAERAEAWEVPGGLPCQEWAHPVWSGGRRVGALRWGIWTDGSKERSRADARRLWAAWAWAAAAGGLVSFFLARGGAGPAPARP